MLRITLAVEDHVLQRLREKADREARTLQEVANELLRQSLYMQPQRSQYRLKLEGWDAVELPGVDVLDRDKLLDLPGRS